jgi:hypothetical protein
VRTGDGGSVGVWEGVGSDLLQVRRYECGCCCGSVFDFVVRNLALHLLFQQQAKLLRSKVRTRPAFPLLYSVMF